MGYTKELVDEYGSLGQAASVHSLYLHEHGLFHAEAVIDELLSQRNDLLEALQAFVDVYGIDDVNRWMKVRDNARAAITKALGS